LSKTLKLYIVKILAISRTRKPKRLKIDVGNKTVISIFEVHMVRIDVKPMFLER